MKEGYVPSETQRYEISRDAISQARFSVIKDFTHVLHYAVPELDSSFTLFGSLSKGKVLDDSNAAATDIDLAIFFTDPSRHDPDYDGERLKINVMKAFGVHAMPEEGNTQDIELVLRYILLRMFQKRSDAHVSDLSQLHIAFIRMSRGVQEGGFPRDSWGYEYGPIDLLMFCGIDLGGYNRKYIQNFLLKVDEKNKASRLWGNRERKNDEVWHHLSLHVATKERGGEIPASLIDQFPKTFSEACRRYGVQLET